VQNEYLSTTYIPRESIRIACDITARIKLIPKHIRLITRKCTNFLRRWVIARIISGISKGRTARTVAPAEKERIVIIKI